MIERSFVGKELKSLLKMVGIEATPTCSCNRRAKTMDREGIAWCEENADMIIGWLKEEATKRKLPFVEMAGRVLLKRAIKNAKKALAKRNNKIFVQLVSQNSPQIINTVNDLLASAKYPDKLRVTIGLFGGDDVDRLESFNGDPRFTILNLNKEPSMTLYGAKNRVQQEYRGEEFVLQATGDIRFAEHFDEALRDILTDIQIEDNTGKEKPVLTCNLPRYNHLLPDIVIKSDTSTKAQKINFSYWKEDGLLVCADGPFDIWDSQYQLIRARFYGGDFTFALGSFIVDVPHDPNLSIGEDVTVAARAIENEYVLYHPAKVWAWKSTLNDYSQAYDEQDIVRYSNVLGIGKSNNAKTDKYCLNSPAQSLNRYTLFEKRVGVIFRTRQVTDETKKRYPVKHIEYSDASFEYRFTVRTHCIHFPRSVLSDIKDYQFISVIIENDGGVLKREDLADDQMRILFPPVKEVILWRDIPKSDGLATKACVWPYLKEKGWAPEPIRLEL